MMCLYDLQNENELDEEECSDEFCVAILWESESYRNIIRALAFQHSSLPKVLSGKINCHATSVYQDQDQPSNNDPSPT